MFQKDFTYKSKQWVRFAPESYFVNSNVKSLLFLLCQFFQGPLLLGMWESPSFCSPFFSFSYIFLINLYIYPFALLLGPPVSSWNSRFRSGGSVIAVKILQVFQSEPSTRQTLFLANIDWFSKHNFLKILTLWPFKKKLFDIFFSSTFGLRTVSSPQRNSLVLPLLSGMHLLALVCVPWQPLIYSPPL